MDNSPYKIRFDILAMAKDLLMEEWNAKRMALEQEWHAKVSHREAMGGHEKIEYPDTPSFPSVGRITDLATELNAFVSRKS